MEFLIPPMIMYLAVTISIIIATYFGYKQYAKDQIESSLIKILPEMSESLNAGYSLDMTINSIALKTNLPISSEFVKIKSMMIQGIITETAFKSVAKASKNKSFMLLAEIISSTLNNRIRSGNIGNLYRRLVEIGRQENWRNEKIKSSILIVQFAGIVIIPLLFYMITSIISTASSVVTVDTNLQIFFIIITPILASLNYIVFRDFKTSISVFLLGSSAIMLILTTFGPMVGKLFALGTV
jgi:hypothetical protein